MGQAGAGCGNQISGNHAGRITARAGIHCPAARQGSEGVRAGRHEEYKGDEEYQERPADSGRIAGRSHARHRRPSPEADESQQGFLSRRRNHQARRHQLLRCGGTADSSASARPPVFAEALSQRHQRKFFFQKDAEGKVPEWVRLEPIFSEHNQDKIHYIICNDRATLIYLANLACIDQNPWMSRVGSLDQSGFRADRSGPYRRLPLQPDCRSRATGEEDTRFHRDSPAIQRPPAATECTSTFRSNRYTRFEQVRSFAELLSILVINQKSGSVHHAAHGLEPQEGQGLFRLPADFERQDNRRSLCFARASRRSGLDAAGLVRSEGRPGPGTVQHPQRDGSFRAHGRSVRRPCSRSRRGLSRLWRRWRRIALHQRHTGKNDQHRDHFLQSDVLAKKEPAEETRRSPG